MRFIAADDAEAVSLRQDLADLASGTEAAGLMTANLWLWEIESSGSTIDPRTMLAALFDGPDLPCRELLEPRAASGPWVAPPPETAHAAVVRLLTTGTLLEIPVFFRHPQAASAYALRLLAWVGRPLAAFASMEHRPDGSAAGFGVFRLTGWEDEVLVLVGSQRVALLCFVGTD
jgi:hypothetical protein